MPKARVRLTPIVLRGNHVGYDIHLIQKIADAPYRAKRFIDSQYFALTR